MVKIACFLGENARKGGKMLKLICFFRKVLKMGDKMLEMACFLGENAENWLDLGGELQKNTVQREKTLEMGEMIRNLVKTGWMC